MLLTSHLGTQEDNFTPCWKGISTEEDCSLQIKVKTKMLKARNEESCEKFMNKMQNGLWDASLKLKTWYDSEEDVWVDVEFMGGYGGKSAKRDHVDDGQREAHGGSFTRRKILRIFQVFEH